MRDLPKSFYVEETRRGTASHLRIWLFALLAVASGWLLFGLPGAPLHLLRLPEDMPGFGFGLNDIFIDEDGSWIIKRTFYADRMSRYELDPLGNLTKFRGSLREQNPEMEGRPRDRDSLQMPNGTRARIRP